MPRPRAIRPLSTAAKAPGPEYVAPMVAYLCSEASRDVNGQLFHAERSMIHTYRYGEEARAIYKYTDDGLFSVDELVETIPGSLMSGIPNAAPAEEASNYDDRGTGSILSWSH